MRRRGRPCRLTEEHQEHLKPIVADNPTITLEELRSALQRRTELDAHIQTNKKSLEAAGIKRTRGSESVRIVVPDKGAPRYGYTDAHRRQEPEQTYPSCLTDAEWSLVEDLFNNEGRRGTPPRYSRRLARTRETRDATDGCGIGRTIHARLSPGWRQRLRCRQEGEGAQTPFGR